MGCSRGLGTVSCLVFREEREREGGDKFRTWSQFLKIFRVLLVIMWNIMRISSVVITWLVHSLVNNSSDFVSFVNVFCIFLTSGRFGIERFLDSWTHSWTHSWTYPSTHLPIHPPTYPSTHLPIHPLNYPSSHLPIHPLTYPSTHLHIHTPTYPPIHPPTCPPTFPSTYPPIHLPIHASSHHSSIRPFFTSQKMSDRTNTIIQNVEP